MYYHTHTGPDGEAKPFLPRSGDKICDLADETGLPVDEKILKYVLAYF